MITARDLIHPETTQLDRIEAQNLLILELLTKKKTASKPRASTEGFGPAFTKVWSIYPKRAGANPKGRAFIAYNKRCTETINGNTQWLMSEGTKRYAKFCDATGKTGTEYVMQAATFFGPDKHYENDWKIPAPKTKTGATEITTASHDRVDFNKLRSQEQLLDATDPYAELKS